MAEEEGEKDIVSPNTDILDVEEEEEAGPDFNIKPSLRDKFKPGEAKEIIRTVLEEEFKDKPYNGDESNQIVQKLSKLIKKKVEEVTHQNYKIVVEVTLVEQRGAGVRSDLKCIWDSDADGLASDVFISSISTNVVDSSISTNVVEPFRQYFLGCLEVAGKYAAYFKNAKYPGHFEEKDSPVI